MSHATSTTPAIRVGVYDAGAHHNRYQVQRRESYSTAPALAMPIPNARTAPPPPLPPPRHVPIGEGQDPGWQFGNINSPNGTSHGGTSYGSIKPGSSLLGGYANSQPQRERSEEGADRGVYGNVRRESSSSTITKSFDSEMHDLSDEDRQGLRRPSLANHRLTSENQLGQNSLNKSSQLYDRQLLSKIGGPNTPSRTTGSSFLSTNAQDTSNASHNSLKNLNGQLKPLSVPSERERLHPTLDSPISWTPSGAVSPGHPSFRSPVYGPGSGESFPPRRFGSISTIDDNASTHHRGSYDYSISESDFTMEENGLRDLNINDRSPSGSDEYHLGPKSGLKRRASSPPSEAARDDRPTGSGPSNDLYHRRSAQMLVSRNSPGRFHVNQGSLSSASSLSQSQRTGSLTSSYTLSTASTATSYSGEQRLSPGALSPSADAELGPVSPYAASRSLNPSPRGSLSRPHHQRGPSENELPQNRKMSTDQVAHSRQNSVTSRIQGSYICECCPKKPKKFDSEEELRLHELEKQYTCQFCPNRFKNKNEAERHQNSLHLRRHSWSCAALAGVQAAFHPSTVHPASADVCGYCGEEFPNPANWDARSEHLNHVHKFGECNQAKKFFRADHFRQHLKHSHAGTSGKWTNMLETACMKEEPPVKDRVGSVSSLQGSAAAGLAAASKPGVIDEVHNES